MYNLIEHSSNYSETTGILWFYSKGEATKFNEDIANDNNFKSFKYKPNLFGNTEAQFNPNHTNGILKKLAIAVPVKYSVKYSIKSNFWRWVEMPLTNSKV